MPHCNNMPARSLHCNSKRDLTPQKIRGNADFLVGDCLSELPILCAVREKNSHAEAQRRRGIWKNLDVLRRFEIAITARERSPKIVGHERCLTPTLASSAALRLCVPLFLY
jgi:hypothetical protein